MASGTVRVTGLAELRRAFRNISKDLDKELRGALIEAASPVKDLAEQFALGGIRNMPKSPDWADMKTGVTGRAVVYVAPFRRNSGGSPRPNLKGLLQQQMDTALDRKQADVVKNVEQMLDDLADHNGF